GPPARRRRRPRRARRGARSGQVDAAPPAAGQMTAGFPEDDCFGGPLRGVVKAAVERLQVLPARALCPDPAEQGAGLGGARDDAPSRWRGLLTWAGERMTARHVPVAWLPGPGA